MDDTLEADDIADKEDGPELVEPKAESDEAEGAGEGMGARKRQGSEDAVPEES
jgi:hypothetical protein